MPPKPTPTPKARQLACVAIASLKGGAAKTTSTCILAVEAMRAGKKVAVIDHDPTLGSLTKWISKRSAAGLQVPSLEKLRSGGFASTLTALEREGYDLLLIDTRPAVGDDVRQAVLAADLVLVPSQPSPLDIEALGDTVRIVHGSGRPAVFLLTRAKAGTKIAQEAAEELSRHGPVCPSVLSDRTDYAVAMIGGMTLRELRPSSAGAAECQALWSYIAGRLDAGRGANAVAEVSHG